MCNLSEDADALFLTEANQLGIIRRYDPKPIAVRSFDWEAWIDPERKTGYGKTEVEAVLDLMED